MGQNEGMKQAVMLTVCAAAMAGCASLPPAHAWSQLGDRVRPGMAVEVTDAVGTDIRGRVVSLSADGLTVTVDGQSRVFDATAVRAVRRDGDAIWNGLVVGAAIGVLGAALPDNRCSGQPVTCNDRQLPQRATFFAVATAAGVGLDALRRDRSVLYRASGQSPDHVARSADDLVQGVAPLRRDNVPSVDATQFEAGAFKALDGTVLPYRVIPPLRLESGRSYPLVLQLHGSGGIGTDNLGQFDMLAKTWTTAAIRERYPAFVLVPQFPIRSANYGPPAADQRAEPSPALTAVLDLVESFATSHPIDRTRIYAVGFSMGGSAAWLSPTMRPGLFAAIVPMSGIAPGNAAAPLFVPLPVFVLHGNGDDENPITADRRFIAAIRQAGGRAITLREYQGLDHNVAADTYPGLWWRDWLFAQQARRP